MQLFGLGRISRECAWRAGAIEPRKEEDWAVRWKGQIQLLVMNTHNRSFDLLHRESQG